MNLGATDNGFPSRDEVPAKILTEHLNVSSQLYEARCCTFFAVVFHLLGSELSRLLEHASMDAVAAIDLWNKGMCDMLSNARSEFFGRVQSEYEWLKYSYFDNAQGPKEKVTTDLRWYMCRAYGKMISDLPQLFKFREDTGINEPKLVIAIDDAQPLWETNEEFRPADILCKTISFYSSSSEYESNSAWVVFASTSPKVATCVVPQPQICTFFFFEPRRLFDLDLSSKAIQLGLLSVVGSNFFHRTRYSGGTVRLPLLILFLETTQEDLRMSLALVVHCKWSCKHFCKLH